jgi:8-oxo-dGTP pyrophosphatase MutT (NUDIX family)
VAKIDFKEEPKVVRWMQRIKNAGCTLLSLTPLSLLHKKNGELLFALCQADVQDPDGKKLPKYIFIRGNACIVVPLVKNAETGAENFCMIRQRRIGNGENNLEFPAGMLDRNIDKIKEVAAKELLEETGLSVSQDDLFELSNKLLYSSAGASDEGISFWGCIISLSNAEFTALEGRCTGSKAENEHITVTLCTKEEADEGTASVQARLALYLFADHQRKTRRSY